MIYVYDHVPIFIVSPAHFSGTSNWSGDYFTSTAGVGIVIQKEQLSGTLVDQLNAVFARDWTSEYAVPVSL